MLEPPAPISALLTCGVESDSDLKVVRDEILRFFAAQPTGDDRTAQQVVLVATELAGNALRHGRPPAVVRLLRDDACYIVDVSDRAVHAVPQPAPDLQILSAGGRGLRICLAIAEQVCWYATDTAKHVWASFPRA